MAPVFKDLRNTTWLLSLPDTLDGRVPLRETLEHHLLRCARFGKQHRMGVCWEIRGEVALF